MKQYHKITTLWAREDQKPHNMVVGQYALPEFEQLANSEWVFTEKVDGTNIRIMWDGNRVMFGGKSDNAQIPTKLLYTLEDLFRGQANEQKLEEIFGGGPACLYGEGYGAGIQAAGKIYDPEHTHFCLFDVKAGDRWLERDSVEDVASKLDIELVPVKLRGTPEEASHMVAGGFGSDFGGLQAEGLVGTPAAGLRSREGERIITKLKTKDFDKLNG